MAPNPVYAGLDPAQVWHHFSALNEIPRPSGQEEAARHYIRGLAEEHGAVWRSDARGNCVVRVPARNSNGNAPIVVLQSHLDMVCQQRPEVSHDFKHDPICPRRVGDQIFASGTTLGADNGLGAAMAMAILTSLDLTHGPLELLFTVEEETGLYGAAHLDPELVRGRMLINLDSEDPDEITVGCAGGAGTSLTLPLNREELPGAFAVREIRVSGLKGGHSGIQISEPLANALKMVSAILDVVESVCPEAHLCGLEGGTAHNAIPRDAKAILALPAGRLGDFERAVKTEGDRLEAFWREDEPGMTITTSTAGNSLKPIIREGHLAALQLLRWLPHGVLAWSERFEGKVQTSSNLAEVHTGPDEMEFGVSNRSFLAGDLEGAQERVAGLGRASGAGVEVRDGYPGWEPNPDSALLAATERAFQKVHGKPALVEVVHAGLECGILSEKLPGLDAVSFGPLIRGAHTPEEWVSISSVLTTWEVLTTLLAELAG